MKKDFVAMTPQTRKRVIAISACVVCIGIAVAFAIKTSANQNVEPAASEPASGTSSNDISLTVEDISVPPISESPAITAPGVSEAFRPESGKSATSELTSTSKDVSKPPKPVPEGAGGTDSNGNKTPPTNPALTNKDKKPEYTSTPVVEGDSDKGSKPSSSEPKAGDTKDGKTYMPGFGWVDGTGGGEGEVVEGDWGGGEQVGIME